MSVHILNGFKVLLRYFVRNCGSKSPLFGEWAKGGSGGRMSIISTLNTSRKPEVSSPRTVSVSRVLKTVKPVANICPRGDGGARTRKGFQAWLVDKDFPRVEVDAGALEIALPQLGPQGGPKGKSGRLSVRGKSDLQLSDTPLDQRGAGWSPLVEGAGAVGSRGPGGESESIRTSSLDSNVYASAVGLLGKDLTPRAR